MLDLCLNAPAFHGPLIVLGTNSHVKSITYEFFLYYICCGNRNIGKSFIGRCSLEPKLLYELCDFHLVK
jgi:hypothetical protein